MKTKQYDIVDNVDKLISTMEKTRAAQRVFATFSQEQVDRIFLAAASAANKARIPLAKLAVEETGMGVVEDKVIKNNYAAEYIYNAYTFFTSTEIKSFCAYAGKVCLFKTRRNSGIIRVYKRKAKHIQQHESHKNN